jgi:hypothetical protein
MDFKASTKHDCIILLSSYATIGLGIAPSGVALLILKVLVHFEFALSSR